MCIRDSLHVIAYILIFLNTTEQFVKVIVISGVKQIPHHAKHTMSTLCKEIDFLACLQYRKPVSYTHLDVYKRQDMDFKVTGTRDGITATQMDIKVDGLSFDCLLYTSRCV